MDPAEVAPVQALKRRTPSTVGELRKIFGFLSYYRSYIQNFSCIAKPLYDLLSLSNVKETPPKTKYQKGKKKKPEQLPSAHPIKWLVEHRQVLSRLSDFLSEPPVLTLKSPLFFIVTPLKRGLGQFCTKDNRENCMAPRLYLPRRKIAIFTLGS